MEKKTVMKALSVCGRGIEACPECPYFDEAACGRHMCEDALALLKAEEKPTYHTALIFTKRDNLVKYFWGKSALSNQEYYAKEREVQLILLSRYEKGKCICCIKCPINPLPIKGEFEAPSISAVSHTLQTMGWTYKEKLPLGMFR